MQDRVIHLLKNLKLHFLGALCCPNPLTLIQQECQVLKGNTDINKQKYYSFKLPETKVIIMKWEGNGKFMESFLLGVNIAIWAQTTSETVCDT